MKYILVTGGVCSGIGKGIVTSTIGTILKAAGIAVTAIKIDPYVNIDAGTFSPFEHGEVFVLDDGCEVDLDLGNYERSLDVSLASCNNITTGKIYSEVVRLEREGKYLGKTVQIVPHITDKIKECIKGVADQQRAEVCLIELGGTVGDMEGMPFIEALSQMEIELDDGDFCSIHVNLLPCNGPSSELKSKPAQMSVRTLRQLGPGADFIICRSQIPMPENIRSKMSVSCGVKRGRVLDLADLASTYHVPMHLYMQGIVPILSKVLRMDIETDEEQILRWKSLGDILTTSKQQVKIALVGKYTENRDCYTSVVKSFEHSCYEFGARPKIVMIDSTKLDNQDSEAWDDLTSSGCLIVPGGFGIRGVEGKIKAIQYARMNNLPFLGICLGFQLAAIEYARNVLNIKNAHSAEFAEDVDGPITAVVVNMPDHSSKQYGGTMRLGLKTTIMTNGCKSKKLYGGQTEIQERHRHRYEINPDHIDKFEQSGLRFVGRSEDGKRMEIMELVGHDYFVGVQFHPEYLSRPFKPAPLYRGLVEAALAKAAV